MNPHNTKIMVFLLALCLPLGYVMARYWTSPGKAVTRPMNQEEREQEKLNRLQQWLSEKPVSLQSTDLDDVVQYVIRTEGCLSIPSSGQGVRLKSLNDDQRTDLIRAVTGFLRATARDSADDVFAYMKGRHEKFANDAMQSCKKQLASNEAIAAAKLKRLTDKEVFKLAFTKLLHCHSHWQAILSNSGCVSLWTTRDPLGPDVVTAFGHEDNAVFQNIIRFNHSSFEPEEDTFELCRKRDGVILIADVKVVLQYDGDRLNEPRPHYIRFWFDPSAKVWHPHDLVLVATVDGTYPVIAF
jgi:hypothetical protein